MARVDLNTLLIRWSKKEEDFIVYYPKIQDGGFAIDHICGNACCIKHPGFESTFIKELEKRGYDLKTLKFTIRKKK